MSETQVTPTTKETILEASAKQKRKASTKEVKGNVEHSMQVPELGHDLDDLMSGNIPEAEELLFNAQEMMDFESKVDWLVRQQRAKPGFDPKKPEPIYMEVDDKFLTQLNGGTLPKCRYVIWKNIRVCQSGASSLIAKEEGKTVHEVVFKNESKYRLVNVLKK
jgi:hypothetical protein